MCCRYYMETSPALQSIVEAAQQTPLFQNNAGLLHRGLVTEGEVRPGDLAPVLATSRNGRKASFPMIWGYSMAGNGRPLINARSETAMEKKTFMDAWMEHRCIVPASWYFEWEHQTAPDGKKMTVQKYAIRPKGSDLTWLCGLYRLENGFPHFVILTREPGKEIAFIHDRMPLMMPKEAVGDWINPRYRASEILPHTLTECAYEKWT